jgi:hypothetical protein
MREDEIPALHRSSVSRIAEYHDLPCSAEATQGGPTAPQKMPRLAEGPLFFNLEVNLVLVSILLGLLVVLIPKGTKADPDGKAEAAEM